MLKMNGNKKLMLSAIALATAVVGAGLALGESAQASVPTATRMPVLQQVGYAGQLSQTVTGQLPVTFRLYGAGDKLLHEETITADIRQGRFQVYVGSALGDLKSVLKDSLQMKVVFQGNVVDSLSVIHASQDDLLANAKQYASLHAVILPTDAVGPVAVPNAIAGTCSIVNSGFFTVPFTNTTVGTTTPGCGASVAVSGGFSFLTTPAQGVIVFGLFPVVISNWQVNYQVGPTPATLQTSTVCCI